MVRARTGGGGGGEEHGGGVRPVRVTMRKGKKTKTNKNTKTNSGEKLNSNEKRKVKAKTCQEFNFTFWPFSFF
jgi:hypothetical protein